MIRKTLVLFSLLILTAALGACGGDSGGDSTPDNGSTMEWGSTDVPTDTVEPDAVPETSPEVIPETQPEIPSVCQSDCDDEWAKECAGAGFRTCQDSDDDGCFTWSEVSSCPSGTTCVDGACVASCPDQPCTTAGAKKCEGATTIVECGDFDNDGCMEWGNADPCGNGLVCSGGFCASTCQNECTVAGAVKCEGNSIVTCGDANSDGCLEWGGANPCGDGLVCSSGFCAATCENDAPSTAPRSAKATASPPAATTTSTAAWSGAPPWAAKETRSAQAACARTPAKMNAPSPRR